MERYRIPRTIVRYQTRLLLALLSLCLLALGVAPTNSIADSLPQLPSSLTGEHLLYSFSRATTQSTATLSKGRFLVASRDLNDPNFAESVILLLDYNENGARGVIINRPTEVSLAELLPEVKSLRKRKDVTYIGGPVTQHMVMILTQTTKPPADAQKVFADIHLISPHTELERVLQAEGKKAKLRAYVGYAGWAAGQLDMEVARGGWLIVPAEVSLIFDQPPTQVWPELIRRGEAQWTLNHALDSAIFSLRLLQ